MSIVQLNNQEAYFVAFKGLGVCLTVVDGKLTLVDGGEDETPETELNRFLATLRSFVRSRRSDIRKTAAIKPLILYLAESAEDQGMPKDVADEITSAMSDSDARCRKAITEAEDLMIDVTDLMMKFGIKIRSESDEDDGDDRLGAAQSKIDSLLKKLRGSE